jgi:hypothetical protein
MRRTGQGHRDAGRSPDAQHGNADGHPGEPGLAAPAHRLGRLIRLRLPDHHRVSHRLATLLGTACPGRLGN